MKRVLKVGNREFFLTKALFFFCGTDVGILQTYGLVRAERRSGLSISLVCALKSIGLEGLNHRFRSAKTWTGVGWERGLLVTR